MSTSEFGRDAGGRKDGIGCSPCGRVQLLVAVIGLFIVERIYGLDAMAPAT